VEAVFDFVDHYGAVLVLVDRNDDVEKAHHAITNDG
jgi:hypothetical protein